MWTVDGSPALRILKRDGTVLYALVDHEDYPEAVRHSWHMAGGRGSIGQYPINSGGVYLHRLVAERMGLLANAPAGAEVDHENGDKFDCQRRNLRLVRRQQNNANSGSRRGTSQFKGVSWSSRASVWQAHIMVNYKSRYLGHYKSEEHAARAYDLAAVAEFGEFARLNFPDRLDEPPPVRYLTRNTARKVSAPSSTARSTTLHQGSRNGRTRFTDDDVRRIIFELQAVPRRTYASIGAEFGVGPAAIANIARRKSWAHLWDS